MPGTGLAKQIEVGYPWERFCEAPLAASHRSGSSSSSLLAGWSRKRLNRSSRYSCGLIPSPRQVWMRDSKIPPAFPPAGLPKKSQFLRPIANGRTALSATLLSIWASGLCVYVFRWGMRLTMYPSAVASFDFGNIFLFASSCFTFAIISSMIGVSLVWRMRNLSSGDLPRAIFSSMYRYRIFLNIHRRIGLSPHSTNFRRIWAKQGHHAIFFCLESPSYAPYLSECKRPSYPSSNLAACRCSLLSR